MGVPELSFDSDRGQSHPQAAAKARARSLASDAFPDGSQCRLQVCPLNVARVKVWLDHGGTSATNEDIVVDAAGFGRPDLHHPASGRPGRTKASAAGNRPGP